MRRQAYAISPMVLHKCYRSRTDKLTGRTLGCGPFYADGSTDAPLTRNQQRYTSKRRCVPLMLFCSCGTRQRPLASRSPRPISPFQAHRRERGQAETVVVTEGRAIALRALPGRDRDGVTRRGLPSVHHDLDACCRLHTMPRLRDRICGRDIG